ncbi:hypothetical protein p1B12 (plasmid) [Aromatoleum aromaticum EbN1]|uniref:Uncharacterized protein n=1 Tax=Aromatoleum aromaticum (strain DSM 19018 / LMG 30748 / EbN1) TaxID=76114 RepID=Q5NXF4_AROAE|nr:hypothetical protein p1B12 [Aromatoleum aromaticum EbN1]
MVGSLQKRCSPRIAGVEGRVPARYVTSSSCSPRIAGVEGSHAARLDRHLRVPRASRGLKDVQTHPGVGQIVFPAPRGVEGTCCNCPRRRMLCSPYISGVKKTAANLVRLSCGRNREPF